jgi:hypothetical protein
VILGSKNSVDIISEDTVDGRNPAPPKGWLKAIQNNGMFTTVFNW